MAVDSFHWIIFGLHLAGALIITFGIWFRCDPDIWVSRMRVDTYDLPAGNNSGLWWGVSQDAAADCQNDPHSMRCFRDDLPLYEAQPANLGWHLFALLGHFEWVSASFAFFYIEGQWNPYSWMVSTGMVGVGTLFLLPWRGAVFANEVAMLLINAGICAAVFYSYRGVHPSEEPSSQAEDTSNQESQSGKNGPKSRWMAMRVPPSLLQPGQQSAALLGAPDLKPESLRQVSLPAMRFAEYCISASELWVAVLAVFVTDPPAFMGIGGYALILMCNLYGSLLHYSLVSDNATARLAGRAGPARPPARRDRRRRALSMTIPREWISEESRLQRLSSEALVASRALQQQVWGPLIASSMSTLLNSWLAYILAIALICYQQTLLFSKEPPAFVVFAGWSLLVFYSSFGVWITVVYFFPSAIASAFGLCAQIDDVYRLATSGLDVLSVCAKLSIVGSLSFGFVFRAEGRCT